MVRSACGLRHLTSLDLEPTALLVLRMAISWELLSPHARVVFHFSVAVYRFSLHRWQGIGGFFMCGAFAHGAIFLVRSPNALQLGSYTVLGFVLVLPSSFTEIPPVLLARLVWALSEPFIA